MPLRSILSLALMSAVALLPHSDFSTTPTLYTRRRGGVQTKTSEGGRIGMKADYYYFAPTGGRYQTVFRGTLPRRYSIRRSQCGNSEAICVRGVVITPPPTRHKLPIAQPTHLRI